MKKEIMPRSTEDLVVKLVHTLQSVGYQAKAIPNTDEELYYFQLSYPTPAGDKWTVKVFIRDIQHISSELYDQHGRLLRTTCDNVWVFMSEAFPEIKFPKKPGRKRKAA